MRALWKKLRYTLRVLRGQNSAGRSATIFPDDTFLVSYPKSGNTWIRFLIGNLMRAHEPVTFLNIEQVLPSIYIMPDRLLRAVSRPRILKSHECFVPRYPKVIYVVRDPRDIAVSYYYYNLKKRLLAPDCTVDQYLPMFIEDQLDMKCGPWEDHVLSWVRTRQGSDRFLLLRYEDVLLAPEAEMSRVARFLDVEATSEQIQRAIERSSAKQMRGLEQQQTDQWVFTKGMRKDIPFVRAAKSGGWRKELSDQSVEQIESAWGSTMADLGYGLSTQSRPIVASGVRSLIS